jgi:hypothetical protein
MKKISVMIVFILANLIFSSVIKAQVENENAIIEYLTANIHNSWIAKRASINGFCCIEVIKEENELKFEWLKEELLIDKSEILKVINSKEFFNLVKQSFLLKMNFRILFPPNRKKDNLDTNCYTDKYTNIKDGKSQILNVNILAGKELINHIEKFDVLYNKNPFSIWEKEKKKASKYDVYDIILLSNPIHCIKSLLIIESLPSLLKIIWLYKIITYDDETIEIIKYSKIDEEIIEEKRVKIENSQLLSELNQTINNLKYLPRQLDYRNYASYCDGGHYEVAFIQFGFKRVYKYDNPYAYYVDYQLKFEGIFLENFQKIIDLLE